MTYQSFDGHGVDVAVKRADDLDRTVLQYIAAYPGCRVLDLGSGAGGQSLRMATAGAHVTAVDQFDFQEQFAQYGQPADNLRFIIGDLQQLPVLLPEQEYDIVLCQRTIHYLSYHAALTLLEELLLIIYDKLYISVTGSGSLVGDTYPGASLPIAERFCELTALGKDMFSITEPVCLYNQVEFMQLLESAGWTVDECWESAFGNIKAVCSK
jgi:SAM-dependent methyltransferase